MWLVFHCNFQHFVQCGGFLMVICKNFAKWLIFQRNLQNLQQRINCPRSALCITHLDMTTAVKIQPGEYFILILLFWAYKMKTKKKYLETYCNIFHLRHQSSCSSGLTIKPAAQCKLDSSNKCAVHIIFKLCPILEIKTFRLLNISWIFERMEVALAFKM